MQMRPDRSVVGTSGAHRDHRTPRYERLEPPPIAGEMEMDFSAHIVQTPMRHKERESKRGLESSDFIHYRPRKKLFRQTATNYDFPVDPPSAP